MGEYFDYWCARARECIPLLGVIILASGAFNSSHWFSSFTFVIAGESFNPNWFDKVLFWELKVQGCGKDCCFRMQVS